MGDQDRVPDVSELLTSERQKAEDMRRRFQDQLWITITGTVAGVSWGATVVWAALAIVHAGIVSPRPVVPLVVLSICASIVMVWSLKHRSWGHNVRILQDNLLFVAVTTGISLVMFALGISVGNLQSL